MPTGVGHFGWVPRPAESQRIIRQLRHPNLYAANPALAGTGVGKDVFAWECEQAVLGHLLDPWDQGQIGSCVGHGSGRAAQDTLLAQIALGSGEEWPGAEVCREAVYGGSRVEIGHDSGGEGSTGAWAAKWFHDYGLLFYLAYGTVDLTGGYTVQRCRQWGDSGVPHELEAECRKHPIKDVTCVTSPEQARDAVANLHFVLICGQTSRDMKRSAGGWCPKTGNEWPHCEEICGVCVVAGGPRSALGGAGAAPYRGDTPALVERNSWGDYLGSSNNQVTLASGKTITLPAGVYLSTYEDRADDLSQQDSFALSGVTGFPAQSVPWFI